MYRGHVTLGDGGCRGCPTTAVSGESISAVRRMIENETFTTYDEIWGSFSISGSQVKKMLHDHLSITKVCARWVPHSLTEFQKTAGLKWSGQMLEKKCARLIKSCLLYRNRWQSMDLLLRAWKQTTVGFTELSKYSEVHKSEARTKRWPENVNLSFQLIGLWCHCSIR